MNFLDGISKLFQGGDSFSTWVSVGTQSRDKKGLLEEYKNLVYACITAIADDVGNYTPVFKRGEKTVEHPFQALLNYPNPDLTKFELFEQTQSYLELTGEAFWYVSLGEQTRKPKEITILRPDVLKSVVDDETGKVIGYVGVRKDGIEVPFDTEEIIHFKKFNPIDRNKGLGTVEAGLLYIDTETSTSTFQRNFMKNQATPSGILTLKGKITRDTFQKIKKKWSEAQSGLDNVGKTLFIREADAKFEKLGLSLADLDMRGIKELSKQDVLEMFKVPEAILGKTDSNGLGRANIEAIEYIFAKRTIEPKLRRFDDILNQKLKLYYKDDVIITHKSQVPRDETSLLNEDSISVDRWMTRNEIRARRGLEPIQGGDKLYIEFSKTELSQNPVSGEKSLGSIKVKEMGELKEEPKKEACDCVHKEVEPEPIYYDLEILENKSTKNYKKGLRKLLKEQKETVLSLLGNKKKGVTTEDLIKFTLLFSREDLELNLLGGLFASMVEAGKLGIDLYGEPDAEFILEQARRESIFNSTDRLLKSFNEETALKLQKQLSLGMQEGESIEQLSRRVQSVYEEADDFRATRIAMTESHNAINEAVAESFIQSGYKYMRWNINPGACPICRTMEGATVKIGQPFIVQGQTISTGDVDFVADYQDIKYANMHPNCRCYLTPEKAEKGLSRNRLELQISTII